ncbi:hypothetical protein OHA59_36105 [Streptomyces sp. NBC_01589]|uniref:hypothetical protein n=1 Tax=Streptomyces sp. NBC_01589 TaxID=2975886 RepID=UPI00386BACE7
MGYTFARQAAVAVASAAVAAAGLLATGGSASAVTPTTGDRPAVVSHWSADAHHEGWSGRWGEGWGEHHDDGRGYWVHHRDGHRYWVHHHDDRGRYQVSEDDARRQWVLDQVQWLRDHDARRY